MWRFGFLLMAIYKWNERSYTSWKNRRGVLSSGCPGSHGVQTEVSPPRTEVLPCTDVCFWYMIGIPMPADPQTALCADRLWKQTDQLIFCEVIPRLTFPSERESCKTQSPLDGQITMNHSINAQGKLEEEICMWWLPPNSASGTVHTLP